MLIFGISTEKCPNQPPLILPPSEQPTTKKKLYCVIGCQPKKKFSVYGLRSVNEEIRKI